MTWSTALEGLVTTNSTEPTQWRDKISNPDSMFLLMFDFPDGDSTLGPGDNRVGFSESTLLRKNCSNRAPQDHEVAHDRPIFDVVKI